jgi:hypothetical protein
MSDDAVEPHERRWGLLIAAVAVPLLTAFLCVTLTLLAVQRSDRQNREAQNELRRTQCALIVSLDDNYRTSAITTDLARRNAATLSQLRTSQGCDPRTP